MTVARPRTVVVDDHPAYRGALLSVLRTSRAFEVDEDVVDPADVLAHAATSPVDLVVCDIHLPSGNGAGAALCRELQALPDPPRVCVVSADGRRDTVLEALAAGATGFVHKSTRPKELVELLLAAAAGEDAFDLSTASLIAGGAVSAARGHGHPHLSGLQLEVLRALAAGLEGDALVERVGLRPAEATAAVRAVLVQTGAANTCAAVAWALRNGVIT